MTRKVGVIVIIAEGGVMLHVIATKSHGGRNGVWQISEYCGPFVQRIRFEDAIMGRIMNNYEHGVIGKGANAEGRERGRPPIGRPEKTKAGGDHCLPCDDAKRNRRSPPIMADETGNFRMRRQNGAAARRMRT